VGRSLSPYNGTTSSGRVGLGGLADEWEEVGHWLVWVALLGAACIARAQASFSSLLVLSVTC